MERITKQRSDERIIQQFGQAQYAIMYYTNHPIAGIQSTMYIVFKALCEKLQKPDCIENQTAYNLAILSQYDNTQLWNGRDLLDWLNSVSYDITDIASDHPAFSHFQRIIEEIENLLVDGFLPSNREGKYKTSIWDCASLCAAMV